MHEVETSTEGSLPSCAHSLEGKDEEKKTPGKRKVNKSIE